MGLLLSDRIVYSSILLLSLATHVILGWKIWNKKRSLTKVNIYQASNSEDVTNCMGSHFKDTSSTLFGDVSYLVYVLVPIPIMVVGNFMGHTWVVIIRYVLIVGFVYVAPALAYVRKKHVRTVLGREFAACIGR